MKTRMFAIAAAFAAGGLCVPTVEAAEPIPVSTAIHRSTTDGAVPVTETGIIRRSIRRGFGLRGYRSYGYRGYPYGYRSSYRSGIGVGLGYRSYRYGGDPYLYGGPVYRGSYYRPGYAAPVYGPTPVYGGYRWGSCY